MQYLEKLSVVSFFSLRFFICSKLIFKLKCRLKLKSSMPRPEFRISSYLSVSSHLKFIFHKPISRVFWAKIYLL